MLPKALFKRHHKVSTQDRPRMAFLKIGVQASVKSEQPHLSFAQYKSDTIFVTFDGTNSARASLSSVPLLHKSRIKVEET